MGIRHQRNGPLASLLPRLPNRSSSPKGFANVGGTGRGSPQSDIELFRRPVNRITLDDVNRMIGADPACETPISAREKHC
jgi:hypothetical protein